MNRRHFLAATSSAALASLVRPAAARQPATSSTTAPTTLRTNLIWHDLRDIGVEGRAFDETLAYFDRLPAQAKDVVRAEVWNLSRCTAGMIARFRTDAASLYVRYQLTSPTLALQHLPATGMSGLDLYARLDGGWRWSSTVIPRAQHVSGTLFSTSAPAEREFLLNLPLYNGIASLELGVPPDATFAAVAPRKEKPIVWYGTSITQGGCASRPGLAFTNILARRLPSPICNFGFSGNGRMEPEVGRFLAEIDAGAFIIDCNANMQAPQVRERCVPLVKQLRAAHATTPILLLEDRRWASGEALAGSIAQKQMETRIELRRAFDTLRDAGDANLHYRIGEDLIGDDGEGTVDGSHPNDLGMMRYADALEADVRRLTQGDATAPK